MPSKNTEKKSDSIRELTKTVSPILVINNPALKPYIELFEYAPENIYQQPLGNLIGFFEIKEYSESSAYVVNFLTSVLKKEYYANPRRSVTESFDSAMHKVNLALSEVAKHGNVEWIGKLHASICVLEKNAVHFTVTGNAKIFLSRKKILTEISEGLSSDESQPHPLKTFVNVSSGRLEKEDRLIITCEDLFHILKLSDLQKNLERLTKQQFVQFLKTALSNELEMIATIVADFEETKKTPANKKIRLEENEFQQEAINVFSQAAFPEKVPDLQTIEQLSEVETNLPTAEYTDKKTGHIYVQGGDLPAQTSQAEHYWELSQEKIADGWHFLKTGSKRNFGLLKKRLEKKLRQASTEAEIRKQQRAEKRALELAELQRLTVEETEKFEKEMFEAAQTTPSEPEIVAAPKKQLTEVINLKEKIRLAEESLAKEEENESNLTPVSTDKNDTSSLEKSKEKFQHFFSKASTLTTDSFKSFREKATPTSKKILHSFEKIKTPKISFQNSTLVPHFSKLKKLYQKFTFKQKLNIFLALLIIFVVPIFIANWLNRPKAPAIKDLPKIEEISQSANLSGSEKNFKADSQVSTLLSNANLLKVLVAGDSVVTPTNQSLFVIKNGQSKEYPLPNEAGKLVAATYMSDLAMVLLLTDQNKLLSFTLSNAKFSENKLELASNSSLKLIGTYLTYLYFLDPSANQIVRYPRADGGFGAKINWLKEKADLSGTTDFAIDDSIFTIQNGEVFKFFKGKKEALNLEASGTPVQFDKIFTTIDSKSLWALDTKNSRLVQYDKIAGTITAQFSNDALKDGTSLAVDEKNKNAYVVTSSGLISLEIQ